MPWQCLFRLRFGESRGMAFVSIMLGWIVLLVFWGAAALLFINVGWKPALTFVALWVLGLFLLPVLGLGPYAFLIYQAILAIPMVIGVKQAML